MVTVAVSAVISLVSCWIDERSVFGKKESVFFKFGVPVGGVGYYCY